MYEDDFLTLQSLTHKIWIQIRPLLNMQFYYTIVVTIKVV